MGIRSALVENKALNIIFFTLIVFFVSVQLGLNLKQTIAVTIFSMEILSIVVFWKFRLAFALLGLVGLLLFNVINIDTFVKFANLDVILFLVGMMIIIGFLEEKKFFEYLINTVFTKTPKGMMIPVLMLMSAFFAALADEVTSILFMSAIAFHLSGRYKVRAAPLIMMVVFATNIGSSATVIGNPVGVLVALKGGLTFLDFIRWATPISIISLLVIIPICMKMFSKYTSKLRINMEKESTDASFMHTEIDRKEIMSAGMLFFVIISLLVIHSPIEKMLGLGKNTMLMTISITGAAIVILLKKENAREMVERHVDWWTLLFFMMLFASVGTLEFVKVSDLAARGLIDVANGSYINMFGLFSLVSGVMSGFMDNVLSVATFIPVIHELTSLGVYTYPFWWAMLFAATFFGNLTIVGSTANIVAIGMMERRKKGEIKFFEWMKYGIVVSVITFIIAIFLIYIQIPLMPKA
ncbi:MAG TPA: SLC13 family permease [archaeon]|nr:SLC13 family permease [archaeon]